MDALSEGFDPFRRFVGVRFRLGNMTPREEPGLGSARRAAGAPRRIWMTRKALVFRAFRAIHDEASISYDEASEQGDGRV